MIRVLGVSLIMATIALCLSPCPLAYGIILHPDGEPDLQTWTDRPANELVGRWSNNASFVVISPHWIITTRHQNTTPATVTIGGITYNCIYNSQWIGGPTGSVDMRLIRLKNLDGSDPVLAYAPLYTNTNENGQNIIIGGYGRGRETVLTYLGITYGYTWGTGANYNNSTKRWCTNIIDGFGTAIGAGYTSDGITATFDDVGNNQQKTIYEGTPAEYDSGGGWFIKDAAVWKLAGLTHGVSFHGSSIATAESWFRNKPLDPGSADVMDAVRISSYFNWISTITTNDCPVGDLDGNCMTDFADLSIFAGQWLNTGCVTSNGYCNGADLQLSGTVNFNDFAVFAQNWLLP